MEPQIIDKGVPTAGLVAHTLVAASWTTCRTTGRSRSTRARACTRRARRWRRGRRAGGASLVPLYEAHRDFVLSCRVLHADETPVQAAGPWRGQDGEGLRLGLCAQANTTRTPGVIYDFCTGPGLEVPGGLPRRQVDRHAAGVERHLDRRLRGLRRRLRARRLPRGGRPARMRGASSMNWPRPTRARWRRRRMRASRGSTTSRARPSRDDGRGQRSRIASSYARPLWDELQVWMKLERTRVPDGRRHRRGDRLQPQALGGARRCTWTTAR